MKVLITIGCSLLLFSCAKKMHPVVTSETKDSIVYKVVPHDTTIYIPGDTVTIEKSTPCAEWNFDTVATNGNLKMHVNVSKGHLTASCKADSLQKVITLLSSTLEHYNFHRDVERVPVEVPVNHIPKWVLWFVIVNLCIDVYLFRKPLLALITRI